MKTKIVKTLQFVDDTETQYQVNAVKLEGYSADSLLQSVSTDYLIAGSDTWVFDCGSSTKVIEDIR